MTPDQLCLHTFTNKPWSIHECIENYAAKGIGGISIWRETIANTNLKSVRKHLTDSKLKPVSLVRGGFFTGKNKAERTKALTTNRQALHECESLGLPMMVMVCGATPTQTPHENFNQIRDGLAALLDDATNAGVKLAIEPLHPMYAGDRCAINTIKAANDLCDALDSPPHLGIALDAYHIWWDLDLETETKRCADANRLLAYHICDFKSPMEDPLLDRGIPGEGLINLNHIHQIILNNGFSGLTEIEIFSRKWWSENQHHFLDSILSACKSLYP